MAKDPLSNAIREYVQSVLDAKRWSGAELARRIGKRASTINKRLNKNYKGGAHMDTLNAIARESGIPLPPAITGALGTVSSIAQTQPSAHAGRRANPDRAGIFGDGDLPVLYTAKGQKAMNIRPVVADRVPRPANLASVADAYGIRVHGDDASPRYRAGELLIINPALPLRAFEDAVFISGPLDQERQVSIWRFHSQTEAAWLVQSVSDSLDATAKPLLKRDWPVAQMIVGRLNL